MTDFPIILPEMTAETIYCPAQTRPARLYVDPEPAEYCTNEVEDYGDYCEEHSYTDADAADDAREHNYEQRMGY